MILDLNATSVEEVTSRLRVFERCQNKHKPPTEAMGKLMLTEDEWRARDKANREQGGSGRGSSSGRKGKCRGKPHGRGSSFSGGGDAGRAATRNDICKSCGKKGHWAKDCRSRPRIEHAHVAHDDEETLMYIEGAWVDLNTDGRSSPHHAASRYSGDDIATAPSPHLPVPTDSRSATTPTRGAHGTLDRGRALIHEVNLVKEKVFATVGKEEDPEPHSWVLDTEATNHMTRSQAAFVDLDSSITGTVRFGNGSTIHIEGCGIVLFPLKSGEHRALDNVYYILLGNWAKTFHPGNVGVT
jgi:hypothetical protein